MRVEGVTMSAIRETRETPKHASFEFRELKEWQQSHNCSESIAFAILEAANTLEEAERIYRQPTPRESIFIARRAKMLGADENGMLYWGDEFIHYP